MPTGALDHRGSRPQSAGVLFSQLWRYRWQIGVDFRKELVAQHRGTLGQSLWIIVLPIIPMTVYLLLSVLRVFPTRDGMEGIAYVSVGATLWYLFSGLVTQGMTGLDSKGSVAVRDSYPLVAVLASSYGLQIFDFMIRALFCCLILALVQAPTWIGIALFLPAMIPPLLLFTGVGLIAAVFSVAVHDLRKLVPIFLQYLFFLSLVIFPLPTHPIVQTFLMLNPLAVFVDNIRHLLMLGYLSDPRAYATWSVVAVLVFLAGLRFFRAAEIRIAEYL